MSRCAKRQPYNMPYIVKSKGDGDGKRFLVINRETGNQRGHFKKKDEAIEHAESLNRRDEDYRPGGKVFVDGE